MGCGCNKGRAGAAGVSASGGTYRVIVGGHQVYESSSKEAADIVAGRFKAGTAEILSPGTAAPNS